MFYSILLITRELTKSVVFTDRSKLHDILIYHNKKTITVFCRVSVTSKNYSSLTYTKWLNQQLLNFHIK